MNMEDQTLTLDIKSNVKNMEINMNSHSIFYYPYASFTNAQLPLLKVAALWFDRLVIHDPVGASWDTVGAED